MTSTLQWFKSSYSSDAGGQCVEVAACAHSVHVRDSKNPTGPTFSVRAPAWQRFLGWKS
jgi:hypothetical protein